MNTMFDRLGWGVGGAAIVTLIVVLAGVVRAGPLDPPGAPAPTMKTLEQVEPRTPIASVPFTIATPGSYYLTGNLTGIGFAGGIQIAASNVTLDLSGFTMTGGSTAGGVGIYALSPYENVTIRNGTVTGWNAGIYLPGVGRVVVEDLRAVNNGGNGIAVGSSSIVRDCVSRDNVTGIQAGVFSLVTGCEVSSSLLFDTGILVGQGSLVESNTVQGHRFGIKAGDGSTIRNCVVRSIGGTGIEVNADSTVIGNLSTLSGVIADGSAILLSAGGNRVEGNTVTDSDFGINNAGGTTNVIVRNVASGNTAEYAGTVGTVATTSVGAEAWANFDY